MVTITSEIVDQDFGKKLDKENNLNVYDNHMSNFVSESSEHSNNISRNGFELFWLCQISKSIDHEESLILSKKLAEEFDKKDWIELINQEISQDSVYAVFNVKIFSVECHLTINKSSLEIKSLTKFSDLPTFNFKTINLPKDRKLPSDQKKLILSISPNASINYLVYSLVDKILQMLFNKFLTVIDHDLLIFR